MSQSNQQFARWTAKRKAEIVIELIKGTKKLVDICREHDLLQSGVESWVDSFIKSGEKGLKANSKEDANLHEKQIKDLQAKVGELVLELDARKKLQALMESEGTNF